MAKMLVSTKTLLTWNFDKKHLAVTAWFAFDDVVPEHGSLEYVQGSHRVFQRRHKDVKTDN